MGITLLHLGLAAGIGFFNAALEGWLSLPTLPVSFASLQRLQNWTWLQPRPLGLFFGTSAMVEKVTHRSGEK